MKGGISIMLKKYFIIILFIIALPIIIIAQEEKKSEKEDDSIKALKFDWPFDRPSGHNNYAQELVFDTEKGDYHLNIAKKYYKLGYDCIKKYQKQDDAYDLYNRDSYRIDALSPFGLGIRHDFYTAEYWFLKTRDIVARYINWDARITEKEEYKKLVNNTFHNLLYTSVYNGHYHKAYSYLNEYKRFSPDQDYVEEWESRILGNIVKLHEKYEYAFTGSEAPRHLKNVHKDLLIKIIERRYANNPKLKQELIDRVYPEETLRSVKKADGKEGGKSSLPSPAKEK